MWFAHQFMSCLLTLSLNICNFLKRLYRPLLSVSCCQVDYFVCRVCVKRRVAKIGTNKNGNTTNFVRKFQINISQKDVHRAYICWWIYLLLTHYDQKPVELRMYYAEAILNHIRMVCSMHAVSEYKVKIRSCIVYCLAVFFFLDNL